MVTPRRDEGFTLTELVVVIALMGFILWAAHGLMQITRIGVDHSNRQAWMSTEVAAPLEFAEKVMSQQYAFDVAFPGITPYRCAFFTNRRGDSYGERYVIEATADHRLLVTNSPNVSSPTYNTNAWSRANFNRQAGMPLFRYFDAKGNPLTSQDAIVAYAKFVTVTIVTEYDGQQYRDERTIFFRNR